MTELTALQEERHKEYLEGAEHLIMFNAIKEMPKMGNMSASRLVDMVGCIKVLEKDVKKTVGLLNGIIDSKLTPEELEGTKSIIGEKYSMKITPVTQYRLKEDLAKQKIIELATIVHRDIADLDARNLAIQKELAACMYDLDMSQHRYESL